MTFSLENAVVYDIESFPNCFMLSMECLNSDTRATWEISQFRDDTRQLMEFFNWLKTTQTAMIGFNNIGYDYPVIHALFNSPHKGYAGAYEKTKKIIGGDDRFGNVVWANDRFCPQIDLFKLNHFDNKAKTTSLKALEINMRSQNVVESALDFDAPVTKEQIDQDVLPYNLYDVAQTKRFAHFCKEALDFRLSMIDQFGVDVLNWNDTKIGEQTVIQKLGDELCYYRDMDGRRKTRQSPRSSIAIKDIIFPYIKFETPEFQRIHTYLNSQVLRAEEISSVGEETATIKTKGVFTNLTANAGGLEFHYGVGGIHASVENKRVEAQGEWIIRDVDVASLYPSIAIANNLSPHHLGAPFVTVYSELPKERKKWQKEKGKKCPEANALKLASNGVYGKSNSVFSPFYDPQFTMSVTVNGQLLLSMLIESLLNVPSLRFLQANTDGLTYLIKKEDEQQSVDICKAWEQKTGLVLESVNYKRFIMRDVNTYIAEGEDGKLKIKGAFWTPDPLNYHMSIAESQPPCWYKNFSNVISTRAAVAFMTQNVPVETFIRSCVNPYDFVCAVKVKRSDLLLWGGKKSQRNTRFYVSTNGAGLIKQMPPAGTVGSYKKANGISDTVYAAAMQASGGQWDGNVCTKNKSKYEIRETAVCAGYNVTVCNDMKDFDFSTINYDWYIQEANKLVIC